MILARTVGLVLAGAATIVVAGPNANTSVARRAAPRATAVAMAARGADAAQDFPYFPYTGKFTFVRIHTNSGRGSMRGFGRGRGNPGWAHDYPDADRNFSKILNEITFVHTLLEDWGGNVLTFDDPRLSQFPVAYISEPGEWSVTPQEAEGLRSYLLKGGFLIFDDFGGWDMQNLMDQMSVVMPGLQFLQLDGKEPIFDSFFQIDAAGFSLPSYRGTPDFWGLYIDNDKGKRMLAIAGNDADMGEFWEFSDRGFYPIDLSNEAYKFGVNYVVYAMTH
jgi:hypothetical protein